MEDCGKLNCKLVEIRKATGPTLAAVWDGMRLPLNKFEVVEVGVTASHAMREIGNGTIKPSDCARTCFINLIGTVGDKKYPAIPPAEITGAHNLLVGRSAAGRISKDKVYGCTLLGAAEDGV
jgi:hypothetical protein